MKSAIDEILDVAYLAKLYLEISSKLQSGMGLEITNEEILLVITPRQSSPFLNAFTQVDYLTKNKPSSIRKYGDVKSPTWKHVTEVLQVLIKKVEVKRVVSSTHDLALKN